MTKTLIIILIILSIRGIAGIVQDFNFFYNKNFSWQLFKEWIGTFKR